MVEGKWYRVTDPLNPLYGCDVTGFVTECAFGPDDGLAVTAMRRVDIFVGDRPFQLVAKKGENLGIIVSGDCIDESPLQDETVEAAYDRPHGLCLDESEMTRKDGMTIRVARYENATQIALEDAEGELLATQTLWSGGPTGPEMVSIWEKKIVDMWERGDDQDDIVYALEH